MKVERVPKISFIPKPRKLQNNDENNTQSSNDQNKHNNNNQSFKELLKIEINNTRKNVLTEHEYQESGPKQDHKDFDEKV